jgi:hypothetical protein
VVGEPAVRAAIDEMRGKIMLWMGVYRWAHRHDARS